MNEFKFEKVLNSSDIVDEYEFGAFKANLQINEKFYLQSASKNLTVSLNMDEKNHLSVLGF